MSRKTVTGAAPGLSYTGVKCPACPAVIQPATPVGGGKATERAGLEQHWLVCHPERPFKQRDAR
jgi:hypothetical protein